MLQDIEEFYFLCIKCSVKLVSSKNKNRDIFWHRKLKVREELKHNNLNKVYVTSL